MALIGAILGHPRATVARPRDGRRADDLLDVADRASAGLPIGNLTSQFFANVYLNPLDHFVKHELRVKGYVRYMDDFLLFGDDRAALRRQGRQVREKLAELRLEIHPDKYRLVPTACGVDFAGFVVYADGRVRVRSASVRRFDRRYKNMLWGVRRRRMRAARVTQSVVAWVAHAAPCAEQWTSPRGLGWKGMPGGRKRAAGMNLRFVSGVAWRQLEQQLQQPVVLQPQQQQPERREQQHRFPCCKPLEDDREPQGRSWIGQIPLGGRSRGDRARLRDYPVRPACPAFGSGRRRMRLVPRRVASSKGAAGPIFSVRLRLG